MKDLDMIRTIKSTSVQETIAAGRSFASELHRGDVVALYGELGSGKTQFVKGVCEAFSVQANVTSPSFIILNRYVGSDKLGEELLVYHLDLYRVRSSEELYDIGFEEFFYGNGICLIEWADMLQDLVPSNRHDVRLRSCDLEDHRMIEIEKISGDVGKTDGTLRNVRKIAL